MGLFDKKIGVDFVKKDVPDYTKEYIAKMKKLLERVEEPLKNEIEKQIFLTYYGSKGEDQIKYELNYSGLDMYIFHDLCIEHNGLKAQIDFLIITRKKVYVIECKNMIGNIEVNNMGQFIRKYYINKKMVKESVYSPLTQNDHHIQTLKELRMNEVKGKLFKNSFDLNFDKVYHSFVVLSNPSTILDYKYAKKEIKDKIVRLDELVRKIKDIEGYTKDVFSLKEMKELSDFYKNTDITSKNFYENKYNSFLSKVEEYEFNLKQKAEEKKEIENNRQEVNSCEENPLFIKLKEYRLNKSREDKIEAWRIYKNNALEEMVLKRPKTLEDLALIYGLTDFSIKKYGNDIVRIIKENETA